MSRRRVVITGMGALTPVGNTVYEFWSSLIEGKSGTGPLTRFDSEGFASHVAAELKGFNPDDYIDPKESRRMDHFVQYAMACADQAVKDSGLDLESTNLDRAGVYIGSGIGGIESIEKQKEILDKKSPRRISPFLVPMLIVNMASGMISMRFKFRGPNSCVVTACATGTNAIGDATRLIQYGQADVMLAGGTEGAITPLGFGGFCSMKALSTRNDDPTTASRPFDKSRDGFVMGEGAGVVVLEEYEAAKKRGARIYAEVAGYGMTSDAFHVTMPEPEGKGAQAAMQLAIKDAELAPEQVDYINAHGTSTEYNDKTESYAIKQTFNSHARSVAISSTKSMTGHLLGAAGAIECIACAKVIENGLVPPTINYNEPDPECDLDYTPNKAKEMPVNVTMSNSFGFGGHNAVLVLKKV